MLVLYTSCTMPIIRLSKGHNHASFDFPVLILLSLKFNMKKKTANKWSTLAKNRQHGAECADRRLGRGEIQLFAQIRFYGY